MYMLLSNMSKTRCMHTWFICCSLSLLPCKSAQPVGTDESDGKSLLLSWVGTSKSDQRGHETVLSCAAPPLGLVQNLNPGQLQFKP